MSQSEVLSLGNRNKYLRGVINFHRQRLSISHLPKSTMTISKGKHKDSKKKR